MSVKFDPRTILNGALKPTNLEKNLQTTHNWINWSNNKFDFFKKKLKETEKILRYEMLKIKIENAKPLMRFNPRE